MRGTKVTLSSYSGFSNRNLSDLDVVDFSRPYVRVVFVTRMSEHWKSQEIELNRNYITKGIETKGIDKWNSFVLTVA